jgi:hypothetical protein
VIDPEKAAMPLNKSQVYALLQPFSFPSRGTLPDRIVRFRVIDISVCVSVFDKRIISTAIIGISDTKPAAAQNTP